MLGILEKLNNIDLIKNNVTGINQDLITGDKRRICFTPFKSHSDFGKPILAIKGKGIIKRCLFFYNERVNPNQKSEYIFIADYNVVITCDIANGQMHLIRNNTIFEINEKIYFNESFEIISVRQTDFYGLLEYIVIE